MFEIEKGIEKPAAQKRAGIKYPWVTMAVGDFFLCLAENSAPSLLMVA